MAEIVESERSCYLQSSRKPYHAKDQLPTVSLEFRDERGKLKKRERVLHVDCGLGKTQTWKFKKT
jgi:hypothetical protein